MGTHVLVTSLFVVAFCVPSPTAVSAHPSSGIVVNQHGDVYFTDNSEGADIIWKIDPRGRLSQFRKGGWHWLALDARGRYERASFRSWFDQGIAPNFGRVPLADGKAALVQTDGVPIAIENNGDLYFAKRHLELARLTPDGSLTAIAPGLKAMAERLQGIKGLAASPEGSLYASCPSAVLRIKPDGTVTTLIHPIRLSGLDTDLPSGTPVDQEPFLRGLAVDERGVVYAAATGGRCIVKVMPDGKAVPVMKAERPWSPTGVAVHEGEVYVLEYSNANSDEHKAWRPRVRKLRRDGNVITLATAPAKGEPK
jgi:streptogramin lyase